MKEIQRQGSTPKQIVNDFLQEFSLQKEDIDYEIIDKGSRGLLNLVNRKPAIIKFMVPEEKDLLEKFLAGLLKRMNISYNEMDIIHKDNYYYLHVKGVDNPGFLIGKEGKMLNSIQHLMNRILESGVEERSRVILNVDNYRDAHQERMQKKINLLINKVVKRAKSITLEPMNASDRRIVYRYLENEPQVKTMTIGKGDMKRIVIYPATDENEPKASKRE